MNLLSIFIQLCSLVCLIYASDLYYKPPLIFNPYTLQIYNWPDSMNQTIGGPVASVCPANTTYERKTNEDQSIDGKALFVKEFYDKSVQRRLIPECEKSYEMAVAHFRDDYSIRSIEFGYEVYYKFGKIPNNRNREISYDQFGPISEAHSLWTELRIIMKRTSYPHLRDAKNSIEDLKFLWISKIKLEYNPTAWSLVRAIYTVHRNNANQLSVKCDNRNLGKKFYKKKFGNLDDFYDHQKNIFKIANLPSLSKDSKCKLNLDCVKKYDLVSPHHYQTDPSSPVSCSNLTTIPIWYEITEKLLDYLETFLIAVGQISEQELNILPGVLDTLTLRKISGVYKLIPMYLNLKGKKIPIPKIIYKIVRYRSYKCQDRVNLCWFSVVIVIHNHPKVTKKDRICPKDKCKEWGWDNIQYMNTSKNGLKSKHIYCCRFGKRMQKLLGYELGNQLSDDFNLKDFPYYENDENDDNDDNDNNFYEDRQKKFEDQMEKLRNEIQRISETAALIDE